MKKILFSISFVLLFVFAGMAQYTETSLSFRYDHYYSLDDVYKSLHKMEKEHPDLVKLEIIGKSEEGRDVLGVTICNRKTGEALEKPAIYLDGNIHGNEIQATEVCLYFLDYVLSRYGKNERITEIVDRNTLYSVPVVNVDGRYHFFKDANTASSNRGLRILIDDDRDGLFDEDFPDDLDGDGNICQMRIKDPYGRYKLHPEDPRIMVRVKQGEKGEYSILGSEGIDNDGDGRINEDSEGYVDPNRNWPINWKPNYIQRGAGHYPLEGTGLKAIAEWLEPKINISMVFAFHNAGGMYLRGPSTKESPDFDRSDISSYDYIGKQAERLVPGYRYLVSFKDLYVTHGDFGDFTDFTLGAYTFVGELFQSSTEQFRTRAEEKERAGVDRDKEKMDFSDHLTQGEMYSEWKPYTHPLYGDIEIGGWVKYSSRMPQGFMLPELVHRNASVVLYAATQTPDVSMELVSKEKTGKNLYRICVRLENKNALPSMASHAFKNKIYTPDYLKVKGKGIEVLQGGELLDKYQDKIKYKMDKPEIQFFRIPGFDKKEFVFIIQGNSDLELEYHSAKAKDIQLKVKL